MTRGRVAWGDIIEVKLIGLANRLHKRTRNEQRPCGFDLGKLNGVAMKIERPGGAWLKGEANELKEVR